jgi:hypothetical protein
MDEACAYAHTPTGIRFCSLISLIEVLIWCENLSKYVIMYSLTRNTRQNYKFSGTLEKELAKKKVK